MKIHQLFRVCYLYLLMAAASGCKKGTVSNPNAQTYTTRLSTNALAYTKLTPGKYLIYKDSATSLLDSVVVTTSQLSSAFIPQNNSGLPVIPAHYMETLTLVLTKMTATTQTEWFRGSANAPFPYPFASSDTGALTLTEPDNMDVFSMLHSSISSLSVTVEGQLYNNVLVYTGDFGGTTADPFYKNILYYWAPGVGIIKRRVITTGAVIKTQALLRHN